MPRTRKRRPDARRYGYAQEETHRRSPRWPSFTRCCCCSSYPRKHSKTDIDSKNAMETAILSHLRHITPTGTTEKRVRVRRTLAECLTSEEALRRLNEDELRKLKQKKTPKNAKRSQEMERSKVRLMSRLDL